MSDDVFKKFLMLIFVCGVAGWFVSKNIPYYDGQGIFDRGVIVPIIGIALAIAPAINLIFRGLAVASKNRDSLDATRLMGALISLLNVVVLAIFFFRGDWPHFHRLALWGEILAVTPLGDGPGGVVCASGSAVIGLLELRDSTTV